MSKRSPTPNVAASAANTTMKSSSNKPEPSLLHKNLGIFPYFMYNAPLMDWLQWDGFTLPCAILYATSKPKRSTIRHEMIHYCQYKEMAVLPFIVCYLLWHLIGLLIYLVLVTVDAISGRGNLIRLKPQDWKVTEVFNCANFYSYISSPFELEAFTNERKRGYLDTRPPFAWVGYLPAALGGWKKKVKMAKYFERDGDDVDGEEGG